MRACFREGSRALEQLPGPCAGHPDRRRHRLRRSRHPPSPHASQRLCIYTAFVPMSFIFGFVEEAVSGKEAGPGTAPRTPRGASRPSQASSQTVRAPAKSTRIRAPLYQFSVCTYEFYFSICLGACFREGSRAQNSSRHPARGIQTVAGIVSDGPGTRQAHTHTSASVSIQGLYL